MKDISTSVRYVKGVGPKRGEQLRKLQINTIKDLLYFIPRDYEDRSKVKTLREGSIGERINLEIEIIGQGIISRPRKNLSILKIPFKDSSGMGYLIWFNQEYLKNQLHIGQKYMVSGKINRMGREIQIMNPICEKPDDLKQIGKVMPIYPLTEGLSNTQMIRIIETVLKNYIDKVEDILPVEIRNEFRLMDMKTALKNIHFPESINYLERARKTLAFQELLVLQLGLLIIKNKSYSPNSGIEFPKVKEIENFVDSLPFKLTRAQLTVFDEIEKDMESSRQMSRLVQGDVGSGKTIVAILAMLKAVLSGYQSAMMAPTEILAVQHYEAITNYLKDYDIRIELLIGSLPNKKKLEIVEDLKSNKIDILIGTHAVIQENVEFFNLGLAITDEQHRFGVKQRGALSQKGLNPDILVMTATPIPRTLALILYGDLDISIIDELPPGRKAIDTYGVRPDMVERINNFIKKQLDEGRQAYIVCPLIEESETLTIKAAEDIYKDLKDKAFKEYNIGLLHGKMKPKDKDSIMEDFKNHKIDILVSTTVIEVGVNVPNANIMVIYNAERFGLAQLHQLRGRVGRGEYQSYCILINDSTTQISWERMRILQNSTDGFIISEKDLELRGPGEFFGTRQHGIPELKVANLIGDMEILKVAQNKALEMLKEDPYLKMNKHKNIRRNIVNMFENIEEISFFN